MNNDDKVVSSLRQYRSRPLPGIPHAKRLPKKKPVPPPPPRRNGHDEAENGKSRTVTKRRLSELGRRSLRNMFGDGERSPPKVLTDFPQTRRVASGNALRPAETPKMTSPITDSGVGVRSIVSSRSRGRKKSPPPPRPLPPVPREGQRLPKSPPLPPARVKNPRRLSAKDSSKNDGKGNNALAKLRKYRESTEIKALRNYDSDSSDSSDEETPAVLTRGSGRNSDADEDPILRMTLNLCRREQVTYIQVKETLVKSFGIEEFDRKKKAIVRILRWKKEVSDMTSSKSSGIGQDVAPDAVWKSGTSLIEPVIDPAGRKSLSTIRTSSAENLVEGLKTNAPLQHSFNYLQNEVLGHAFLLVRVIRARGLKAKGSRSVTKASSPCCTVTVGASYGETEVVESSNEPQWRRQFTFPFDRRTHPFATIEVQHKGPMGSSRFLGRCVIPLTCMPPGKPILNWYRLRKRSKKSHVSGEIQVQCICSPSLSDTVSRLYSEVRSQSSLYISCSDTKSIAMGDAEESASAADTHKFEAAKSASTPPRRKSDRPPSYRRKNNATTMDGLKSASRGVTPHTPSSSSPSSPSFSNRMFTSAASTKSSARVCKMCSKILRQHSTWKKKSQRTFDTSKFCSKECDLFFSAVEKKGFKIRSNIQGAMSICTEETAILARSRALLKDSLAAEEEYLSAQKGMRDGDEDSPSAAAVPEKPPKKWILNLFDLKDRLVEEFGRKGVQLENDLITSEWHAFKEARRESSKRRLGATTGASSTTGITRLPPRWEALEIVWNRVAIFTSLLPTQNLASIERRQWLYGCAVLTDWRFVFMQLPPEHFKDPAEVMTRVADKFKRGTIDFEKYQQIYRSVCGCSPLKVIQVSVGAIRSVHTVDTGEGDRAIVMCCNDMRTIHVRCARIGKKVAAKSRSERGDSFANASRVARAHDRVAETRGSCDALHEAGESKLVLAVAAATNCAATSAERETSKPIEMSCVHSIESPSMGIGEGQIDERDAFLLMSAFDRLHTRSLNAVEERLVASKVCVNRNVLSCNGKLWRSPYNFYLEMRRLRLPNRFWRVSLANETYGLCSTYPKLLIVPRQMDDESLRIVAKYRSRERFPTVCWRHRYRGAAMLRCSQPCSGIAGNYSEYDEKLLALAHSANPVEAAKKIVIIDARPLLNAMANQMKGKGYEAVNETHYTSCEPVRFMNIGNIHVMRKSLAALTSDCHAMCTGLSSALDGMDEWFGHISRVLEAAVTIAKLMHDGHSTVVHCSDGWDRTPQLCALSQLMMDSYYRTWKGFQVLVEKEWISFGHKFAQRCGGTKGSSERSPIFLQFCDCVFQCMSQFPTAFEFNSQYLAWIVSHLYSNWFGNFLGDNEKANVVDLQSSAGTVSIWECADANKKRFLNPRYNCQSSEYVLMPAFDLTTSTNESHTDLSYIASGSTMRMSCGDIVLWSDCYLRHAHWIPTTTTHQLVFDSVSGIWRHVSATALPYGGE